MSDLTNFRNLPNLAVQFFSMIKKFLQQYIPLSILKKWYYFKNPGAIDEVDIAWKLLAGGDPHRVMVDVGAHVGNSLEPFARKGWKVYAFEPDPKNRKGLTALCSRFPNVTIEPVALSDSEKEDVPFFTSNVSTGISSLLSFHTTHEAANLVRVTTLKTYCREQGISNISFLKTDTEGYDLPVLRGVAWEAAQPRVIVSEFDNFKTQKLGYDVNDQVNLLKSKGYMVLVSEWHPIEEYGRAHKWRRFVTDTKLVEGEKVWGNVIAVKPADWDSLLKIARKFGPVEM